MTELLSPCWGVPCSQNMTWRHDGTRWRAKCSCGFSTRAAVGDAAQLDARAKAATS